MYRCLFLSFNATANFITFFHFILILIYFRRSDQSSVIAFVFFLLGILKSSCDNIESFEKLWSSLCDKGNVIFISFGLILSNDGSYIFLLLYLSEFSVSVESPPFYSLWFLYFRSLFPLLLSLLLYLLPKIFQGFPYFLLFFLFTPESESSR